MRERVGWVNQDGADGEGEGAGAGGALALRSQDVTMFPVDYAQFSRIFLLFFF